MSFRRLGTHLGLMTLTCLLVLGACSSSSDIVAPNTSAPNTAVSDTAVSDTARASTGKLDLSTVGGMCEVLTAAEVAEALGVKTATADDSVGDCYWETDTPLKSLSLAKDPAPARSDREAWNQAHGNSSWDPFDLGTAAFSGKIIPSVEWIRDGWLLTLTIGWSTKGDPIPVAQKLARLVDGKFAS